MFFCWGYGYGGVIYFTEGKYVRGCAFIIISGLLFYGAAVLAVHYI